MAARVQDTAKPNLHLMRYFGPGLQCHGGLRRTKSNDPLEQ